MRSKTKLDRRYLMKAILEKLFRFIIVLFGGFLTMMMTLQFLAQYNSYPITSKFVIMRNKSFTIPTSTLCVTLTDKELTKNNYFDFDLNITKQSIFEDIEYLNETVIDRKMLLEDTWSLNMLRVVRRFLMLTQSYKAQDQIDFHGFWRLQYFSRRQRSQNRRKVVDAFFEQYDRLLIKENELLQKFGQELLKIYPIKVIKYEEVNGSLSAVQLPIEQMTFLSETKACFRVQFVHYPLRSLAEYFYIEADKSFLPYRWEANQPLTLDFLATDTGYTISGHRPLYGTSGLSVTASIKMLLAVDVLPKINEDERCSSTITPDNCAFKCRIAAVEQRCNCTPYSTGKRRNTLLPKSTKN